MSSSWPVAPPARQDLLDAVRELSFARDLARVAQVARASARRLTGADAAAFIVREASDCRYLDEDVAPHWKGRRVPASACIAGWVIEHRTPAAIADVYADARVPPDVFRTTFVRSLLIVPVRLERPAAAIGVYWTSRHEATGAETAALAALAEAASSALTNVQLWTDLQQAQAAAAATAVELEGVNRELRRRIADFETLLDVLPIGIGIARDASATDIRTNRAFSEILRVTPQANISMSAPEGERPTHFRLLLGGREVPPEELPLQTAVREGRAIRNVELEVVFDSGDRLRLLENAAPLFDEQGQARGSIGAFVDVTERAQIEERRERVLAAEREAREEAERTNRLKDEFLASLSHELRTPLNAILGWTQLLRRMEPSAEFLARGLETLERNARLQTQLIDDLLDMSRILSGKVPLDVAPVSPMRIIEAAVESVRPSADARGLTIETALDPAAGPVAGDATRLHQIVWNLLTNAVKFTEPGGRIDVALERVEAEVVIRVADSGIGIAPEFLPHVFERFRQADASTTRQHRGLGIGLSIVKHLVELHGGTVRADSAGRGRGATLVVALPFLGRGAGEPAMPSQTEPASAPGPAGAVRLDGVRVLVVDDDEDSRALAALVLEGRGASVTTAGSAADALERLRRARPDVIVSDIGLPGQDGVQLLRAVRALGDGFEDLLAVAVSAFARPEDRRRAIEAGFRTHLSKPVEPADLCAAVAQFVTRRLEQT